jgi:hypothetical protein
MINHWLGSGICGVNDRQPRMKKGNPRCLVASLTIRPAMMQRAKDTVCIADLFRDVTSQGHDSDKSAHYGLRPCIEPEDTYCLRENNTPSRNTNGTKNASTGMRCSSGGPALSLVKTRNSKPGVLVSALHSP